MVMHLSEPEDTPFFAECPLKGSSSPHGPTSGKLQNERNDAKILSTMQNRGGRFSRTVKESTGQNFYLPPVVLFQVELFVTI